ncbi:hypothetical protein A2U01_0045598, partial [Trifolium medium]|nr:hypothetical protein [Trifolium medium]
QQVVVPLGLEDGLDHGEPIEMGLVPSYPSHLGPQEVEVNQRFSSVSEPEEVLQTPKEKSLKQQRKHRKQKSCSKFHQLGVPMCYQLLEVVNDQGLKARRRRPNEGIVAADKLPHPTF